MHTVVDLVLWSAVLAECFVDVDVDVVLLDISSRTLVEYIY